VGRLVLITGGVRSGKSGFGEQYAARLAPQGEVCYVATAQARDDEMRERVARHRARRPATWRTVEAPYELAQAVDQAVAGGNAVVLVDSVDSWVANRLMRADPVAGEQLDGQKMDALEETLLAEARDLAASQRSSGSEVILVTLEAGMGVVPPYPLGRAFRDLLGRANTTLAAEADEVYLLVAGLPVEIKSLSARSMHSP